MRYAANTAFQILLSVSPRRYSVFRPAVCAVGPARQPAISIEFPASTALRACERAFGFPWHSKEVKMPRSISLTVASITALCIAFAILPEPALAQPPVAKTVPWLDENPLEPHQTWSGKTITLKGTCTNANQYTWNPGDGSPAVTAPIGDPYAIEKLHTYTGVVGTLFTATLTCTNTAGPSSDTENYYVEIWPSPPNLEVEVNVAIDEGLWYLHKTMQRTAGPPPMGDWLSGGVASGWNYSTSAANINAFEVTGHVETGAPSNPYTETVARGMRQLFAWLTPLGIGPQTNPGGTFNPDANANGRRVEVNQRFPFYQGGMFMDAIVASGTPAAVATTGPAGVIGQTYATIVQDMTDAYAYCQYDSGPAGGGWRYSCNEWPDNSACQWAAIGIVAAERNFGAIFHPLARSWNDTWLTYSQAGNGVFGYTGTNPIWGPYATTPSGMVQLAMVGIGGGNPRWDKAETFMRDNFGNTGGWSVAPKDYTYGLFSLVKALLLHDSNADKIAEPLDLLRSMTPGVPPIDWYKAEASAGAPTDGVARYLVNRQNPAGWWSMASPTGAQNSHHTAWALIMLRKTVVCRPPAAVATAFPNPSLANQEVILDGTGSYHRDPARSIVSYEWDLNNDGTYEATGAVVAYVFPVNPPPPPPDVPFAVKLRVTDDGGCDGTQRREETTISVVVSTPPVAPTADAGGPYVFCIGQTPTPWRLNGIGSVNPDDGIHEPGAPPDAITAYDWDNDGDLDFNDFIGATPDVTAYYLGRGVGDYLVQLRVTDNTAASFPSSGQPNLTDTDSGEVRVRPSGDPLCVTGAFTIDIKPPSPGVAPVSLPPNPKSLASIPVAILGTAISPVADIDQNSLTFGRTGLEKSLVIKPNGRPQCATADVNGDFIGDLVCHFYTVIANFQCGDTLGNLKGRTLGGQPIQGSDPVKVVGQGCKP